MDIAKLKEKLGDETFTELQGYVNDLVGQRDAARTESINGRKKLKDDLASAQAIAAKALEKLGVDSPDDLENLPDAKGQAEALKQWEVKFNRLQRENADLKQSAERADGLHRDLLWQQASTAAVGKHKFIAPDVIASHIGQSREWDGDKWVVKSEGGALLSVDDAFATVAKSRPELLHPAGTGGAGVRQSNAGSGGKSMTEAEFNAKSPREQAQLMASGYTLTD